MNSFDASKPFSYISWLKGFDLEPDPEALGWLRTPEGMRVSFLDVQPSPLLRPPSPELPLIKDAGTIPDDWVSRQFPSVEVIPAPMARPTEQKVQEVVSNRGLGAGSSNFSLILPRAAPSTVPATSREKTSLLEEVEPLDSFYESLWEQNLEVKPISNSRAQGHRVQSQPFINKKREKCLKVFHSKTESEQTVKMDEWRPLFHKDDEVLIYFEGRFYRGKYIVIQKGDYFIDLETCEIKIPQSKGIFYALLPFSEKIVRDLRLKESDGMPGEKCYELPKNCPSQVKETLSQIHSATHPKRFQNNLSPPPPPLPRQALDILLSPQFLKGREMGWSNNGRYRGIIQEFVKETADKVAHFYVLDSERLNIKELPISEAKPVFKPYDSVLVYDDKTDRYYIGEYRTDDNMKYTVFLKNTRAPVYVPMSERPCLRLFALPLNLERDLGLAGYLPSQAGDGVRYYDFPRSAASSSSSSSSSEMPKRQKTTGGSS